ncbi:MAG TPA: hypothetical protein VHJ78_00585 [Actinomycetota bacterium]|nr:hypothetical protein [Actinomycetota bacterium]
MPESQRNQTIYQVRLRIGDAELEIGSSDRNWVDEKLSEYRGLFPGAREGPSSAAGLPQGAAGAGKKVPSLAEHVQAVGPVGGLEHVLAVGYYLERHSRLKGGFRRRDVSEAFSALKYRHSNPGVPIAAARRRGLLMDGDEHEKMLLTESAERWVRERLAR